MFMEYLKQRKQAKSYGAKLSFNDFKNYGTKN